MRVDEFDYDLPPELIAQQPLARRDASRLMVVDRDTGRWLHARFRDLPRFLRAGDCLVLNDTRVRPARLYGRRPTGGQVEFLLLQPLDGGRWLALARPGRRVRPGTEVVCGEERPLRVYVEEARDSGERVIRLEPPPGETVDETLHRLGRVPLPPYIRAELEDPERYQTVYAREEGSVAAPTAGLHFTPELLKRLQDQGVRIAYLTLHVGVGTFRPVTAERVEEHQMHAEFYRVEPAAAEAINAARAAGGRVIAVGTTVTRTLETVAAAGGTVRPGSGWTDLFIYPGYRFKAIDGLITNFHLPRSTLIMLVAALLGKEQTLAAYREAVARRYRFFSFGDAMLILPGAVPAGREEPALPE
ncbi:tRNA preQ1(34) S-adenosylmethionine ribosyltransferase-isomerase QueA [Thermaerobacter subterraneus]|uniref:S-adenosylmethionine:tRNA ribosyltransferase-isomerase n=1 Tax=Thermaerobacter subterraneus DSM 13965 TaxID=867903 RepID=K6NYK9_9FIRM|nr:tRNA preQ1(34) S-adenosylmethionine ribosyltransferase-isomerase QueA [Thermaerobacter subterraneus]EKP93960.1 S-adenosylmethionine--tRNA ribosyltransferase-isomerase [Thermaerobacter subterraneus DSM 13965]